jgi:phosphoesterase RecJ-like protein
MSIEKIVKQINKTKSFLITSHVNLEGDALGSALALQYLLRALGKKAQVVMEDECPAEYRFLPAVKTVKKLKDMKHFKYDAFVAVDCSDLGRCRRVWELADKDKPVINIDHHKSNSQFGVANWVDPKSSSACEMMFQLFKRMHVRVGRNEALCMYTGMLTDTGSFRHPNTTYMTHRVASELMRCGVDGSVVYAHIYQSIGFEDVQLLLRALNTIKFDRKNGIVYFSLKNIFLAGRRLSFDLTEQILNFGRMIAHVRVVVLFKENMDKPDQVRVNLRSSRKVDISTVARMFGGGGHKNASACTVNGKLEAIQRRVLRQIVRLLNP